MRFMMLMIPKGYETAAAAQMPEIEWAQRCPASDNEVIEVRQVQELADFPDDVKKVAAKYPEMQPKKRHP